MLCVEFVFCCGLLGGIAYASVNRGSPLMGLEQKRNVKAQDGKVFVIWCKGVRV